MGPRATTGNRVQGPIGAANGSEQGGLGPAEVARTVGVRPGAPKVSAKNKVPDLAGYPTGGPRSGDDLNSPVAEKGVRC